jgi:hypothetical protein
MSKLLLTVLLLTAICGFAFAGDYILVGVDSIAAGTINAEIPFYIERTCPAPTMIMGQSSGFVLTATGEVSWSFVDFTPNPIVHQWFSIGGLLFSHAFDNVPPDTFLTGSATMPPWGMPVTTEVHFFSLFLDIGPGVGELCIDSAYVLIAGTWKLSGLQCGLGGAPDRPLFIDRYGSDDNHPICITIYEPLCGDATLDGSVDIDDPVFLISYIFQQGPAPNPIQIADVDCSGGVDIDDVVYILYYIFGGSEPCENCP